MNSEYHKVYYALEIAKFIVDKCISEGKSINGCKLQWILYILQRKYLQDETRTLFVDDIRAYKFSPRIDSVYWEFYLWNHTTISFIAIEGEKMDKIDVNNIDVKDRIIIGAVVDENINKQPWEFSDDIKAKGKAWDIIYNNGKGDYLIIPVSLIYKKG